ncbi:MAG: cellulase family glycosylhydrolase, partial [Chloroflexi bacterium]|nr:cellulase family glycosylhydrolase [Chloroflexota bacterium]
MKPVSTRIAIFLVLVALLITGCGDKTSTSAVLSPTAPPKTPKPTFTPLAMPSPTLPATATAVPVISPTPLPADPSPTLKPSVAATRTPTLAPTATATPARSLRMASPEYGMQAFLWWRPEVASRDVQMIREAGFGWVKVNFGWRDIEGAAKGHFDWSRTDYIVKIVGEAGLDLVVRVDHQPAWAGGGFPTNGPPDNPQDLADFLTALASRYKGRIRAYEVWNEPNLAREWGGKEPDPGNYVKLLKRAYAAIKAADPNAMVISAGLSPTGTWNNEARPDEWYLESMYVAMEG